MINKIFSKLEILDSTVTKVPLEKIAIKNILKVENLKLPQEHIDFLCLSNGIETFDGYFRILGFDNESKFDLLSWNHKDNWKFAWGELLKDYFCFAENAFGDQYAYKLDEMNSEEPPVYFVEGVTMKPEKIANGFREFLEIEFLRNSINPYDENLLEARKKFGKLKIEEHITYVPSILITGDESTEHLVKIDTITSMIVNGDLCEQLADETHGKEIKEIKPYKDKFDRNRIQVIWA